MKTIYPVLFFLFFLVSCTQEKKTVTGQTDPLPSWNQTEMKAKIISFVENGSSSIPVEDRIAVFDMDGTIACERPFSMEQVCSSKLAFGTIPGCNANPKNLQDSILKAFGGGYLPGNITVDSLTAFFTNATASVYNSCIPVNKPTTRLLCNQFYKPMIELIEYLQENQFEIYVISGSSQPFIRGILKNVKTLKKLAPSHIFGSLQCFKNLEHPEGKGAEFYYKPTNFLSDVSQGKAINIYNRIGKKPVFAFGNTVGDFDMFSITSYHNSYSTLCILLNHDSKEMEDAYKPFTVNDSVYKNWNQPLYHKYLWNDSIFNAIIQNEGWNIANMSECFNADSLFVGN